MYDVIVVGGGPTGNFLSAKLAHSGFKVVVIEEHPEIGLPVHCTGLVGEEFFAKFHLPQESILKKINSFKVFSPAGKTFSFPKRIKAFIVDRGKFDADLAGRSSKAGTKYFLSARVKEVQQSDKKVKVIAESQGKELLLEGKICVLSTGSMSNLPYECGISRPRFFYKSVQTLMEISDLEGAEMYIGNHVAPGSFAYAVSTNGKVSKIGLITRSRAKTFFDNLINSSFLKDRIEGILEPVKYRRVPMGLPKETVKGRIIALGDAACQLKTTTGGGLYYGMLCATILHQIIKSSYNGKDFSPSTLKSYDKKWKKEIGLELQTGILVRNFFERVEDKYLNKLVEMVNGKDIQKLINQEGNYERHRDFIISLARIKEVRKLAFEMARNSFHRKRFFSVIFDYVDSLRNMNFSLVRSKAK